MERLTLEQLARLVDEPQTDVEREILAREPELQAELDALRSQTAALKALPAVLPPKGDWSELEARLVDEGLVYPGQERTAKLSTWWVQVAAGLVLFFGGALAGNGFNAAPETLGPVAAATFDSPEEAAQAVEFAERQYLAAVDGYQRTLQQPGQPQPSRNPASRFAALEALLAASQAAVKESPADPFFNGMLVNTLLERQQTLRQISQDNWY